MTETKCFRDVFRDQLHELFGQPNISLNEKFHYVFLKKITNRIEKNLS